MTTKTQLNLWVYEEDAAAIRAKAADAMMSIGEYVTRTVLGRDPAHRPSLEKRVALIERLLALDNGGFDADEFERFRSNPERQALVERILGDEEAA